MLKCKNCGEKIIKFPIKDSNGKLIWINLFKMDFMSIVWLIVIILLAILYKADIKQCEEIITDPLTYCEESNACKIIEERKQTSPFGLLDLDDIPKINNTKW